MSKPTVESGNGALLLQWQDWELAIEVTRTRQHRDGRTTGEVKITTTAPGVAPLLHQAQLNFTSSRSQQDLARILSGQYGSVSWTEVIGQLCFYVLEQVRQGEPVEDIDSDGEFEPPRYLLRPLLPLGKPTVLFGQGGTSKSYLALAIAACVRLPWQDNPLGLEVPEEPTNVLYLDYETDRDEIGWRLKCLTKGMGTPKTHIRYRRCAAVLSDDIQEIKKIVEDSNIGLVVVDSLGLACGGELKESQPAITLFGAIRQMKVTSLLLTHTTKPQEGSKDATPYGSAFFSNYARSVWEVRKVQELGADSMEVGLFHSKVNSSKMFQPIGFHIAFTDDMVTVKRRNVTDIPGFAKKVPIKTRVYALLRSEKRMLTVKHMAETLSEDEASVRKALDRMAEANEAKRYGDVWGLLSKQAEPF